jgi:hypothetical protein
MGKKTLLKLVKAVKALDESLWEIQGNPESRIRKMRNDLVKIITVNGYELTLDYKLKKIVDPFSLVRL